MDELTKITNAILTNNPSEVELLTATYLSEAFDAPMFSWEWHKNPKRDALLIGLTFMHTKPDSIEVQDKTAIFQFMGDTTSFVEYIKYIETSEGITGWVRLFNEMAHQHYLEIDIPETLTQGYFDFLEDNDLSHPISEALSKMFPSILEKTSLDVVIEKEDNFTDEFQKDWV